MDREELQRVIIKKAWEDREFRKKLKKNPGETIQEYFGMDIRADITVLEETKNRIYFTIPVNPSSLTDAELDAIAGGFDMTGLQGEGS